MGGPELTEIVGRRAHSTLRTPAAIPWQPHDTHRRTFDRLAILIDDPAGNDAASKQLNRYAFEHLAVAKGGRAGRGSQGLPAFRVTTRHVAVPLDHHPI
jgi:hypothetical protein